MQHAVAAAISYNTFSMLWKGRLSCKPHMLGNSACRLHTGRWAYDTLESASDLSTCSIQALGKEARELV